MNIKHILVDMDPTNEEQPALKRAISIAKQFNASIELFLVVYNSSLMVQWLFDEEQQEQVKQSYLKTKQRWLDTYISEAVDAKISVSVDVQWHKPIYAAIIKKAKQCHADLVIKSTHRHSAVNKILFSPNDWQLLKTCPVPLLLAKQGSGEQYHNIMAAVDPAQSHGKPEGLDKVILDTTIDFSDRLSATAHVTHIYEPIDLLLWQSVSVNIASLQPTFAEHGEYMDLIRNHHKEQFKEMLGSYNFLDENKHLKSGNVVKVLPDMVDSNNIDLLIMGTTYRTGLLGSTVEKILDNVNCDILAVKPEGFQLLE